MSIQKIQDQLIYHINDIIDRTLELIKQQYPKLKFDREKCRRDLDLVLKAIIKDVKLESVHYTSAAGMAYLRSYNSIIFHRQKNPTIFALVELKKIVTSYISDEVIEHEYAVRFDLIIDILDEKVVKEVIIWDWIARILPLVGITALTLVYLIGDHTLFRLLIISVITTFFTVGVIWWWWALTKIASVFIRVRRAQDHFQIVLSELDYLKKSVKQIKKTDTKTVDKSK